MRNRFKFLGDMGIYYFLWVVSEPVPDYEEWRRRHSIREMPPPQTLNRGDMSICGRVVRRGL